MHTELKFSTLCIDIFIFPALIKAFIDSEIIGPGMILDNVWKEYLNSLLHGAFELASKKIAITLHMTTKFLFGRKEIILYTLSQFY